MKNTPTQTDRLATSPVAASGVARGKGARDVVKFNSNQWVVYSVSDPIFALGGVAGLQSPLTPMGAIVKVAAMKVVTITGLARCSSRHGRTHAPADTDPKKLYITGALRKYADQVGPAVKGVVIHAGGKVERVCYADI